MTPEEFLNNLKLHAHGADYEVMRNEYLKALREANQASEYDLLEIFALGYYCRILDIRLGIDPDKMIYDYYEK